MKKLTLEKPANIGLGHALDNGMVILLVSAAVIGVGYFLAQTNERFLYVLSNGLPPLLASAAFVAAAVGLVRNGVTTKDRVSVVWLCYAVGILLWLLGESTWAVYTLWYWIPIPFPSPADGFWLAGYVPLMCAMVILAWPFREFFYSRKMLTASLVVFVLAALLLVVLIPPTYSSEIGKNSLEVVVGLAYPLLDVALLIIAVPILFLFRRGTFWRPFLFVTIGLLLTFLADVLFTWATLSGAYYDGSYLELFFHWSYLTLAYGFYLRFRGGTRDNLLE
jgi:hypothetical protein